MTFLYNAQLHSDRAIIFHILGYSSSAADFADKLDGDHAYNTKAKVLYIKMKR